MSTASKLWLGFGTLIALLLGTGALILLRARSIAENVELQANVARARSKTAMQLEIGTLDYGLCVTDYLRTGTLEAVAQTQAEVREVEHWRAEYERLAENPRERELAQQFGAMWREFHALGESLMDDASRAPPQTDVAKFHQLRHGLERFLDAEVQAEAERAYEARKVETLRDLTAVRNFALGLLIGALIIALMTSGTFGKVIVGSERRLRDAREFAESIVETIREPLLVLDGDLSVIRANRAFYRVFKVIPEETEGRPLYGLGNGQWDIPALRKLLAEILPEHTEVHDFELEQDFPRVGRRIVRLKARRLYRAGNNATLILLAIQDITEAELALRRVRQNRELLQVTLASIGDGVVTTDKQGRVTFLNEVAQRLAGWTQAEAEGKPLSEVLVLINEDSREPVQNPVEAVLDSGQLVGLANHTLLLSRDGKEWPVDDSAAPIQDVDGAVIGVVMVFREIGEQRRATRRIAESEGRTRAILETALDAIVTIDHAGKIVEFNPAAERTFGYRRDDVLGRELAELIVPPSQRELHRAGMARYLATGVGSVMNRLVELSGLRADGTEFPVEASITPIQVDGPPLFTGHLRDITERKQREQERERVAASLAEANRRKDEFLAMLAHELRNPLAPIHNSVEALRQGGGGNERELALRIMERQLAQMVRLIDDLLDVSRISRGKIELKRELLDLASVVDHAIEVARPPCDARSQALEVVLPREPLYVDADPARLIQIVGNLLNNACKFTQQGGRVSLTLEREGQQAVIRIGDNGIGIAGEQLSRIFEMFAQVDTSLERTEGGLGIGLTLVKKLVEMHGGRVEARSAGLGHGSEFVVRLPLAVGAPQPAAPASPSVRGQAQNPRRILLVDDNLDSAESLALLLRLNGHEVHTAHDGLAAVEAAGKLRPEVIVLDIGLPKLNGYEVARRVREQEKGGVFIVALTGWGSEEGRRRSGEAGFDAHLVKPVDFNALTRLLLDMPRSS